MNAFLKFRQFCMKELNSFHNNNKIKLTDSIDWETSWKDFLFNWQQAAVAVDTAKLVLNLDQSFKNRLVVLANSVRAVL